MAATMHAGLQQHGSMAAEYVRKQQTSRLSAPAPASFAKATHSLHAFSNMMKKKEQCQTTRPNPHQRLVRPDKLAQINWHRMISRSASNMMIPGNRASL